MAKTNSKKVPFPQVVSALLDNQNVFPSGYLHRFSDLDGIELGLLKNAWPKVEPSRRRGLLEDLEELSESDTLVMFDDIARLALDDPEPAVRAVAIRMLWESGDPKLIPQLLNALTKDPSPDVRSSAASTLGQYVYLGEIEEIPAKSLHEVEDQLLKAAQTEEKIVRRRALEALGYSGREEVPPLIQQAYDSRDAEWMATALFAMGRSYDQVWAPVILRELRSPDANVQYEAVRAAGEIELEGARRRLLDLLEDEATNGEMRGAAIWSLSQIGGDEVRETLEKLQEEAEDEEDAQLLEEALSNLTLTEEGQEALNMLDIDLADEEHYTQVVDLEHETGGEDEEEEPGADEDDEADE